MNSAILAYRGRTITAADLDTIRALRMVGTLRAVFDVAEDGVEPRELRDGHTAIAAAGDDGLVLESGTGDTSKAGQSIG
ncbi:MAG: hypothetical protein MUE94_14050 [Verrucomicrobia bacterium]|nr:hypothetical protein [Verrucomicrobiota bacterium]